MPRKQNRLGEVLEKDGMTLTIVRYKNANDIDILRSDGKLFEHKKYRDFENLSFIKDKRVYSHGIYETGKYKCRVNGKETREYVAWSNMLQRCYMQKNHPSYKDCKVCEEWKYFQSFAEWYNNNLWDNDAIYVDKDILIKGNKVYSPETCVLVDNSINVLFVKANAIRGEYPIGVYLDSYCKSKKFGAMLTINGKRVRIGRYETPEQAFIAYKNRKEEYVKQIADEYKNKYSNFPDKLYKAMYNYKVEIDD